MKLFGTDGIRGHVGSFLTAPIALQVGFAAGKVLKAQVLQRREFSDRPVVLIGQDSRTSGNMLTSALAAGLTSAGLDVWNLGLCPTPTVAYLTSHLDEAIAGVMVSASHNPPEDNGIKFFGADGTKFSKILQAQVELTLEESSSHLSPEVSSWGNYAERSPLVELYQHSLCNSISTNLEGITVVLDLAWGAATSVAPKVFANLGAKVICLHDRPLGDRINVNCGSTCLDPLRAAVHEHKADMGFAFDGDADRVLAVDDRGGIIDGDYILYLWGQHLLQAQRLPDSCLVTTVMANLGFEKAWQKLGGQMVRTAVGDQYVHAEMMKSGAMLGGEQSGHVLCRHYGVSGDGLLTAIHLAALAKENSPLSELMAQSFIPYPQLLKNVRVEDKLKRSHWQECEPIHQALERAISDLGDLGRVLVRASGTEPLIRVMVEAETLALAQHWTNHLTDTIQLHLVS